MMEQALGIDHIDDEDITFSAKHPDGMQSRFKVERMVFEDHTLWTAREIPTKRLLKEHPAYVGQDFSICEPHDAKVEHTLKRLTNKVRTALMAPSTTVFDKVNPNPWAASPNSANDTGWATIGYEERMGGLCFICDGIAFTGEEFLGLMCSFEGFNLSWKILDQTEDLPTES
jgi:hypothetical protein